MANNREKSRVRVRVEHVFGQMTNAMGGLVIRSINLVCVGIAIFYPLFPASINLARVGIAISYPLFPAPINLAYNLWRFSYLWRTRVVATLSGDGKKMSGDGNLGRC